MPDTPQELEKRLAEAIDAGVKDRLLDMGLARSLIWRDGVLPDGSPVFGDALSEDLLDFGYSVLSIALQLRTLDENCDILRKAFRVAGEAIESVVHRGEPLRTDRGFNCVCAAISFHLGGYAAQAYSVLPSDIENLAATENALKLLLRRELDALHENVVTWLLAQEHQDGYIAQRLEHVPQFGEDEAVHIVLTNSFMCALAYFDHALLTGDEKYIKLSTQSLEDTARSAEKLHFVHHWWTSTLAFHLLKQLWCCSLHNRIPNNLPTSDDNGYWRRLRMLYIHRLRMDKRSAIELWPSQIEAAKQSIHLQDNLIIALPTGAGKTRVAELCMLRTLVSKKRIVYVSPLRALSAQMERDLRSIFQPLDFSVSALYGDSGIALSDAKTMRESAIIVATPEKLDFLLRTCPEIIDDVGLIVLDEGHMIDSDERGVRFEILIQQLLLREDSNCRRIVCLSAMFPRPDEMRDMIEWISKGEAEKSIYSKWRPTRQRFGEILWKNGYARLEVNVESVQPYIQQYIRERPRLRKDSEKAFFPHDKRELTLATAWKFAESGEDVLIFCPLKSSVNLFGNAVIDCIRDKYFESLLPESKIPKRALEVGEEWLGADHVAVQCLRYGVALHHAGLPKAFLNEIGLLLKDGGWPIIIASPTVTQGLNLFVSVLLVFSLYRGKSVIPNDELRNIAGRAGRPFVRTEGLILHVNMNDKYRKWSRRQSNEWKSMIESSNLSHIESGLCGLIMRIANFIAAKEGVDVVKVSEHLLKNEDAWIVKFGKEKGEKQKAAKWERDLASLDTAILGLMDTNEKPSNIQGAMDDALADSLYSRNLATYYKEETRSLISRVLKFRAQRIWSATDQLTRKGYRSAGIGFQAGKHFDKNLDELIGLLLSVERSIDANDSEQAADAMIRVSRIVFKVAPFMQFDIEQEDLDAALRRWIMGESADEVVKAGGKYGVDLLQNVLTYRLPWALESVRIHATTVGANEAERLTGFSSLAAAAGSANKSVILMMSSGLDSREAAKFVVESIGLNVRDQEEMQAWLNSEEVEASLVGVDWQTQSGRRAWERFVENRRNMDRIMWSLREEVVEVEWFLTQPLMDQEITVAWNEEDGVDVVLTPAMLPLGRLRKVLLRKRYIIETRVGEKDGTITVHWFGPK